MKYEQWLSEWLEYYVKPRTKFKTYSVYKQQVEKHIIPALGEIKIKELKSVLIQKYVVDLINKGFSPNTVNGIINIIRNSLKTAVIIGLIDNNQADLIQRPKTREKQVDCFSKDEQKKIEHYIIDKQKYRLYGIIIALYTGLRIGELLALTWDDVDMKKCAISISKTCRDYWENGEYKKIIDTTKTQSSQRVIPFPKQILPLLKELKQKTGNEYVVVGKSIYGAQIRSYQRSFDALLKKLKLSHKGFHSLRHTFATRAMECGIDVKTLSEILGHKNPAITLNRYAHSLFEHKINMMNKLGKFLT